MNINNPQDSHSTTPSQPNSVSQTAGFPRDPAALQAATQPQPSTSTLTAPSSGVQAGKIGTSQWIAAAKSIIDSTADDPYAQTELLYELRTQFMEQVHNRTLKQKDSSPK